MKLYMVKTAHLFNPQTCDSKYVHILWRLYKNKTVINSTPYNILTLSYIITFLQSILDYYFYEQYSQLYFYCFIYSSLSISINIINRKHTHYVYRIIILSTRKLYTHTKNKPRIITSTKYHQGNQMDLLKYISKDKSFLCKVQIEIEQHAIYKRPISYDLHKIFLSTPTTNTLFYIILKYIRTYTLFIA